MSTKIGLISDVHATPEPVKEALSIFRDAGVEQILCAGDIAGYADALDQTVELLIKSGCSAIAGNHDYWHLERDDNQKDAQSSQYLSALPSVLELMIEGKRVYMVHASPPRSIMEGIRLLDEYGNLVIEHRDHWAERLDGFEYDVLVVGHTHQVFAEQLGRTLVVNPGSTKFNHTCAILTFPDLELQWFSLSNQSPVASWNWGA